MLRRTTIGLLSATLCVVALNFCAVAPEQTAASGQQENKPAQDAAEMAEKAIPRGSRVYIAPMPNGFETYLAAGIINKKVPVVITTLEDQADFVISGISATEKAGWAKMLFLGSENSNEQASIKVTNRQSGVVAFAYAVHKGNSAKGSQSAAESCAKHIKEYIEKKK